jgi:glycosyltransferase 2 family protein
LTLAPASRRTLVVRLVLSLLVALGFVWLLRRGGLPLLPEASALARIASWTFPIYALSTIGATFFRTYRWVHLLRPISTEFSTWRVFGIGLVGSSVTFFAPLRSGEIVRPYLLSRERQFTFLQATSTVVAERIIDGLIVTSITIFGMLLATPVSPLPTRLGQMALPVAAVQVAVYGMCFAFGSLFLLVLLFYLARNLVTGVLDRVVGRISERGARALTGMLTRLAEGLSFMASRQHRYRFLRDTSLYWVFGLTAHYLLLRGTGNPVSLPQACVILGVVALGIIVPAGPGVFGTYQIASYTALVLYRPGHEVLNAGSAFVFSSYVAILISNAVCLGLGFSILARVPPRASASPDSNSSPRA